MNSYPQLTEDSNGGGGIICRYQLDFQQNGNHHYYIWRHHPLDENERKQIALLIDLNNVYVPNFEIEKLVCSFLVPAAGVVSIAFVHCHLYNQQEIKRKLKAGDVKLYSRTAFFSGIEHARQWLEVQCTGVY